VLFPTLNFEVTLARVLPDEHHYTIIVQVSKFYSYALPERKYWLKETRILLNKIQFRGWVKLTFTDIILLCIL